MAVYYLVLVPSYSNVLSRGPGTLTTTSEEASFPEAALFDGYAQEIFEFNSLPTDGIVKKDTNLVVNPTFTSSAANWTSGGSNIRYQDINVLAGEQLTVSVVTNASTTGTIQNIYNGNYLTSSGTWQAGSTNCFSVNGSASVAFQIESLIACKGFHTMPLRITVADYTKMTSAILIPAVNFAAVFGHNLGNVTSLFEWSTDDSSWTTAATMTIDQPAYYSYLSTALYKRYWRIKVGGTNHEIPYFGEIVIGNAATLDPAQMWDWKEREQWPAHVHRNDAGQSTVTLMTSKPMRGLSMRLMPTNSTDDPAKLIAIRRSIWERSKAGAYPIVVVPRSSRADVVLGRLSQSLEVSQLLPNAQAFSLDVDPLPYPCVGVVTQFPPD